MTRFTPLTKDKPCPICDRNDGRCRSADDGLILCMTWPDGGAVNGWHFLGASKDGLWGKFVPERDRTYTESERREWRERQQQRERERHQAEVERRAAAMPIAERDRWYRLLLAELILDERDRADLQQRGLSDELIAARGYRSIEPGQRLSGNYPANLPGVKGDRLAVSGGYLIPALTVDGAIAGFQIRLRDAESGRYRWVSSGGNPVNLDSGELPITVANPATANPDRAGWLAFAEGTLKPQLAADRLGCPVIGASGGNFGGAARQIQAAIAHLKPSKLMLLPDGGAVNNPHVVAQYRKLAALVTGLQVLWWGQLDKGADVDEVAPEQLATAELLTWREFDAIARAHNNPLPPNLNIWNDEFIDHVVNFPRTGIVALHGGTGTGKGKAIAALLQGHSWLSVTTLRSLARDQAAGWNGTFLNDGNVMPGDGAVVCVPSLLKARQHHTEILVIDETPTVLEFALSSRLANKQGQRAKILDELERRIRAAQLVILASADLAPEDVAWVEAVRGDRAFIVRSDRQPLAWEGIDYSALSPEQFLLTFEETVKRLPRGKIAILNCDSKQDADRVAALLNDRDIGNLLITSSTSGGDIESVFLASKGRELPGLVASGVQAIVTSPSVKEGFSIEHHTELVDSVWLLARGGSITAAAIAQTLDRVRSEAIPRHLWVAAKGRAYSPHSAAETVPKFMREFRSVSKATAKLTAAALTAQALAGVESIDWQSDRLKLLAHFETRRNRDMARLHDTVWAILEERGKTRRLATDPPDPNAARAMRDRLKAVRQRLEQEHAEQVAAAATLTEWQAQKLEHKENPSPEELLQLERYYLEAFYRQPVTADDVLWDERGDRRQQIRRLERILNPDRAVQHSTRQIEASPASPQDWNKAALQSRLIERSGAGDLIRRIHAGEVVTLTDEKIALVAAYLKAHAQQFALAFGFRNLETVSDRQAIGVLLDWCGLKRSATRKRVEGKPTRQYAIDQANLEALKAVLERRSQCDPPPLLDPFKEGGGSGLDYDPETLADIKAWWHEGGEVREFVAQTFPADLIERAIAS